jgi:hypothetical protein
MHGSGGRGRLAASQVWRADLHGAAPLALLANKPRCAEKSEGASYGMEALALVGLLKQVCFWHFSDMARCLT